MSLSQSTPHELRNCNTFRSRNVNSVKYGTETMPYLAPKIWSVVPEIIKNSKSLESFKLKIRKLKPECLRRLCKTCFYNVGFI